jgi:hypothetical protein
MARFEDTPDLFGVGVGGGKDGPIKCEWCGKTYPAGNESISFTVFGDKQVCDCCFEIIEEAVLDRIDDIVSWFIRILKNKRKILEDREETLRELKKTLDVSFLPPASAAIKQHRGY